MNTVNMVAIVLIIGGILGLAYGSFNYTRETQQAQIGPIELSVKESRTVHIPVWVSIGAIVVGASGGLLLLLNKKSSH
jgi:uncharacterized membrane protein YidH (DUF202 family)